MIYVDTASLKSGHTKSCGCLKKEMFSNRTKKICKKYNNYDLSTYVYGVGWTNKGVEFYFDKEDYEKIKDYCWNINHSGYLTSHDPAKQGKRKTIYFHRVIMDVVDKDWKVYQVDHINHDPLDNRKQNLRIGCNAENAKNKRLTSLNYSGYPGVSYHKLTKKWQARVGLNGKRIYLGLFDDINSAIDVVDKFKRENYGGFYFDPRTP